MITIAPIKVLPDRSVVAADDPTTEGEIWIRVDHPAFACAYAYDHKTHGFYCLIGCDGHWHPIMPGDHQPCRVSDTALQSERWMEDLRERIWKEMDDLLR